MRLINFGNDLKTLAMTKLRSFSITLAKIQHETTVSTLLVDPTKAREEWEMIKPVVVQEGYPKDNTATLWSLVKQDHSEPCPNLFKLSAISIVLAVHTSD